MTALALCLAGCGAQMEGNGAGEGPAAAAKAGSGNPADAGAAPAAVAAAETPVGPCPFATRGWEATAVPAFQPGEKPRVALNGEARPDRSGRMPMIWTLGEMRPPTLVLELLSDAMVEPQADRGWNWVGGVFEGAGAGFTHAAVRCDGVEIARVPIGPIR